jgi:hypothetical protein
VCGGRRDVHSIVRKPGTQFPPSVRMGWWRAHSVCVPVLVAAIALVPSVALATSTCAGKKVKSAGKTAACVEFGIDGGELGFAPGFTSGRRRS